MNNRHQSAVVALTIALLVWSAAAQAQTFTTTPLPVSRIITPSGAGQDSAVRMATNAAGTWIAVWASGEEVAGTGADYDILFARSTDNGATWTDPLPVASTATTDSGGFEQAPDIATDGNGNWLVIWVGIGPVGNTLGGDSDVFVSRSTDDGDTWSPVAPLHQATAAADDGPDYGTKLAMDASGNCVAVWDSSSTLGGTGTDSDILVSRSSNAGATWTAPTALNSNATSDSRTDWNVAITTDGMGNWLTAWDSDNAPYGSDGDIIFARSTDLGASWSAVTALNTNAGSDVGGDYNVALENDGAGNWIAAWTSSDSLGGTIGNDQDVLYARSANNGVSWTAPAPLNTYAAPDSGSDQYPTIVTDEAGQWLALWNTDNDVDGSGTDHDIVISRSTNNGATWSVPHILVSNATTGYGSEYMSGAIGHDGSGNWVVAWWSYESLGGLLGGDIDILTSRSSDNAATWAPAAPLNSNAYDDGIEVSPDVATDGNTWVAVWQSTDVLGVPSGDDYNILTARSTDGGATWSAPANLMTTAGTDGDDQDVEPHIATDGSNWIAVWSTMQGAIYVARSTNAGATWSAPTDMAVSGSLNMAPHLATDGDNWAIVWQVLSGVGSDWDLVITRSSNGGATWSVPAFLNTNAGIDTGYDLNARIAADGSTWMAVWTGNENLDGAIGTEPDILYAVSTDAGATWSAPDWLNTTATADSSHDEDPTITTDGAGNWVSTWRTAGGALGGDGDFLFARSTDDGQTWSAPQPLVSYAMIDSGLDAYVEIAVDGLGKWAAVWMTRNNPDGTLGSDYDILIVRSSDGGATWTTPEHLYAHGDEDSGDDQFPAIAADELGSWVVLWSSNDKFGGVTNGTRPNIFAVSSAGGTGCGDCDDGDPCTRDVCEPSGECANLDAPALTCRVAAKSGFSLKNSDDDSRDLVSWKWTKGVSTSQDEFSDPTTTSDYVMCVYDETGRRMKLTVPAAGTCDGKPCWKKVSTKGYGYKDKAGSSNDVTGVTLKGSAKGKSKAQLKGAGAGLSAAMLPLAGDVTVQLVNAESGMCWGSRFSGAQILVNDAEKGAFKAKAK